MRALIHVHHLLGPGHAVRAAALGRALASAGVEVVLAAGNRLPPTLDTAGLSVAELPPAQASDASFRTLLQGDGTPIDDAWRTERRRRLLALLQEVGPDIILTETYPFGRRMLAFELEPLLVAARERRPRPLVAASVRDILVRKAGQRAANPAIALPMGFSLDNAARDKLVAVTRDRNCAWFDCPAGLSP